MHFVFCVEAVAATDPLTQRVVSPTAKSSVYRGGRVLCDAIVRNRNRRHSVLQKDRLYSELKLHASLLPNRRPVFAARLQVPDKPKQSHGDG